MKRFLWVFLLSILGTFLLVLNSSIAGEEIINWDRIKGYPVKLFYPGVASWEFLTGENHRLGGRKIQKGEKSCPDCHVAQGGDLDIRADDIAAGRLQMKASGEPFEPSPIPGKRGFIDAYLQLAYDDEYVYMKIQWESAGAGWRGAEEPDRVSIQLNSTPGSFSRYGCFINCHRDLNSMPNSPSIDEVSKHPHYSSLKRDDVRLYAYYTRNSGWADIKGDKDLEELLKKEGLVDLWEAEFKGNKVEVEDAWVFNDRDKDTKEDVKVEGQWNDGKYTVVIKRSLKTSDLKDVQLKEGTTFTIGIAIHDNKASQRRHYVSFPLTIGLGAKGDIKAERVK